MTDDETIYTDWIFRCHNPLSDDERQRWQNFYRSWMAKNHLGLTWRDREWSLIRQAQPRARGEYIPVHILKTEQGGINWLHVFEPPRRQSAPLYSAGCFRLIEFDPDYRE